MPHNTGSPLSIKEGGVVTLTKEDHEKTLSWRGRATKLNAQDGNMSFEDKLIRAIDDNRSLFGNKYDIGIQKMLDYYRNSGVLQKYGLPNLSSRVK